MMKFGIPDKSLRLIMNELNAFQEIEKCAVFGSRAMGHYRNGSDLDLVVYGPSITEKTLTRLGSRLNEELPLPYYFDIVHYEAITTPSLREHIDTCGVPFYHR
jgi:predicted nucleotidyltransferase